MSADRRPLQLLALAMALAAALLLVETRGHSLLFDEWSFFADYRGHGPSVLLNPFGGNLELLPIILYKGVFATVGPSTLLLRLILVTLVLSCALLLFVLIRRRVGAWIALGGAALLMVLGAAADIVAATLGIAILLSCALGLGAIVAIERRDRRGDVIAAALLAGAVASNSVGLAFLAGVGADVLVVRPGERLRRGWVVAVPLLLYCVWRAWAAHLEPLGPLAAHPTDITVANLGSLTDSIATSAAAATVTITGLFRTPGSSGAGFSVALGAPLAVALAALAVLRTRLEPPLSRRIVVFIVMPLVYWGLIALVVSDRLPTTSRYQFGGAIFLLLLLAELGRDLRISPRATAVVVAAMAVAGLPNLVNLHDSARFLRYNGEQNRAELAAIELAGSHVDYDQLVEPIGGRLRPGSAVAFTGGREATTDVVIAAGRYLRAAKDFGSPAFTAAELAAVPDHARQAADQELAAALRLSLRPVAAAGCHLKASADTALPKGGARIVAPSGAPLELSLRRFGDGYSVDLGTVPAGSARELAIPGDTSSTPWRVRLAPVGPAGFSAPPLICHVQKP